MSNPIIDFGCTDNRDGPEEEFHGDGLWLNPGPVPTSSYRNAGRNSYR